MLVRLCSSQIIDISDRKWPNVSAAQVHVKKTVSYVTTGVCSLRKRRPQVTFTRLSALSFNLQLVALAMTSSSTTAPSSGPALRDLMVRSVTLSQKC